MPSDLPPETKLDVLWYDRDLPRIICLVPSRERTERPHGEPDMRVIRLTTDTSTSETQVAVVQIPPLDSASNLIVEDIARARRLAYRLPPPA